MGFLSVLGYIILFLSSFLSLILPHSHPHCFTHDNIYFHPLAYLNVFFLPEQIILTNVYTVLWRVGFQSLDLKFDNTTQINTLNKYLSFQLTQH